MTDRRAILPWTTRRAATVLAALRAEGLDARDCLDIVAEAVRMAGEAVIDERGPHA